MTREWTVDEEIGWTAIADAIQCLSHLRDAFTAR
jgi:hypothetical protein